MSALLLQFILQINHILGYPSCLLQTQLNSLKSKENRFLQKIFSDQIILQKELESLKRYIESFVRHSQSLENQNLVLKRIIARSNQSFSTYSNDFKKSNHSNLQNSYQSNKYPIMPVNANFFTEIQKQTQNFNKISTIKHELAGLSQNLKSMTKVYEKYELDSTHDNEQKDNFLNESSICNMNSKGEKEISMKNNEIDLDYLLCHEELSFDELSLQEKSQQKKSGNRSMVDSLIAKGIEFRETRTLRSKEFQNLSNMIQNYRSEFKNNQLTQSNKQKSMMRYR